MSRELGADPRVVLAAYRVLESEGLLEVRARSGVYVRMDSRRAPRLLPSLEMLVDVLATAVARGYSAPDFAARVNSAASRRSLRAIVLAATPDQVLGISRELREDLGVDARPVLLDRLESEPARRALRAADFLVSTKAHRRVSETLCAKLGIPLVVVSVRTDLFEAQLKHWIDNPAHIVVLDPRFRTILRRFLKESGVGDGLRVHLATDDLTRIPAHSPTYVTQAARTYRKWDGVPGMLIPSVRLLHDDCVRELLGVMCTLNLAGRASR